MSGLDGALLNEFTAGINSPANGQQGYIAIADNQTPYPNLDYISPTDLATLLGVSGGGGGGAATGLTFNVTTRNTSATVPTTNQLIVNNGSNVLAGITPGDVMARLTASNSSLAALVFTASARLTWNGSATPTFTVVTTSAIDGATRTIYFPAASLTSIAFDADLDPTGTLAYAFDDAAAAYELSVTWRVQGYVVSSFKKIQLA